METGSTSGIQNLNFFPVAIDDRGEGLPYAPANWPEPGDQWTWKAGKRITVSGYLQDRYLYPPGRFCDDGKKYGMASKKAVKEYIRSRFPNADVDAFFASFSWKIPSNQAAVLELGGAIEMEIDGRNVIPKDSHLNFFTVNVNDEGEGSPYAPVDWPAPGDQWSWKVGRRITPSGYLQDRYLFPPARFCDDGKKHRMASKQAVKEYIQSRFPNADVDAFFASFSWKIPSNQMALLELRGVTEMEIDGTDVIQKESDMNLFPVNVNDKGVGLPYAPVDWPEAGDQWTWKAGNRITASGYLQDRYLYPPARFCDDGKKYGMASKKAVKEFIRSKFPNADVDVFFSLFSWKIPSNQTSALELKGEDEDGNHDREAEPSVVKPVVKPDCRIGRRSCPGLLKDERSLCRFMPCDTCCADPRFCRDCNCILCGKMVTYLSTGGYGLVRCDMLVDGAICGHVAHVKCAHRANFLGTVGGSIGLDAEYYCRRCGSKTDLVPRAEILLLICMGQRSLEEIDNVLIVAGCMLRNSQRSDAKFMLHRISSTLLMVRNGGSLEEFGTKENKTEVIPAGPSDAIKLGGEMDLILEILESSLEQEYRASQKKRIQSLHQQLQHERDSLSEHVEASTWTPALHTTITGRVKQIRRKVTRFLRKGL